MRLAALAFLALSVLPANSEPVQNGTVTFCDTEKEIQRVAELASAYDINQAIGLTNMESHNPTACAQMPIAFVKKFNGTTIRFGNNAYRVIKILVLGLIGGEQITPVEPNVYYAIERVKELSV